MSAIRNKDTKLEMVVRKFLHRHGFRYRLHEKRLPGKPDLVLKKYKTVIFVNGCFWHRHQGCRYATTPATRTEFWMKKFQENQDRDIRNQQILANQGWRIIIVWECVLKQDVDHSLGKLLKSFHTLADLTLIEI
jgi:DNA mismatch endonuclease (patch repair protein)